MASALLIGSVAEFDAAVGWGTVAAADGRRWGFHCTQIADGSRVIDVAAPVTFELVPGHGGAWEAARLRPAR
jgi:hypothetical protein